jgi:hypothetical protein
MALLSKLIVSATAVAETFPARSVPSTPSVNRSSKLGEGVFGVAYLDSRKSA